MAVSLHLAHQMTDYTFLIFATKLTEVMHTVTNFLDSVKSCQLVFDKHQNIFWEDSCEPPPFTTKRNDVDEQCPVPALPAG